MENRESKSFDTIIRLSLDTEVAGVAVTTNKVDAYGPGDGIYCLGIYQ